MSYLLTEIGFLIISTYHSPEQKYKNVELNYTSNALKKYKLICAKSFKSPFFLIINIFTIRIVALDDIPWTCVMQRSQQLVFIVENQRNIVKKKQNLNTACIYPFRETSYAPACKKQNINM